MFVFLIQAYFMLSGISAEVQYKTHCRQEAMEVTVLKDHADDNVYIDELGNIDCHVSSDDNYVTFRLPFDDKFPCAANSVVNVQKNTVVHYRRFTVEKRGVKNEITARCTRKTRERRNVLPPGFEEAEILDVGDEVLGKAVEPSISMSILQEGKEIDSHLVVEPGTPLQMILSLDANSSEVYGIRTRHLEVSGSYGQNEIILHEGCSVDTYLFENFRTVDGKLVTSRFRAFKFPESNYVLFRATVSVCLDRCEAVRCSGDQLGYGRRKRDGKLLFETTVSKSIRLKRSSAPEDLAFPGYPAVVVRAEDWNDNLRSTRSSTTNVNSASSASAFRASFFLGFLSSSFVVNRLS